MYRVIPNSTRPDRQVLRRLGRPATVREIAEAAYGCSTPQTRNRVSVHLTEQARKDAVRKSSPTKGSAWGTSSLVQRIVDGYLRGGRIAAPAIAVPSGGQPVTSLTEGALV